MRWDQQRVAVQAERRLPGYNDVTVRHFDAPEAVDTRFYEIQAKSILNRVPAASQMPFRWTINPYRGCTHACSYCLSGETSILLADGRTRAMRDLRVGDMIVGTVDEGRGRRFVPTEVLAKWSSVKPGVRIVLEDGTTVVASDDHRFLTRRGWKYVSGSQHGQLRRPHLALGSELLGPGASLQGLTCNRVVSITPMGLALRMYDITSGTSDFVANGVISHNCFARPTHEYLDFNAGRDFEREIVVKVNAPERLHVELARGSWDHEHVALGTNTDPYQWAEGRYQLMPGIWTALRHARNPCSVLTKSPLLLRDLALMQELNAVTDFSAALSIPTLDQTAWRATEPRSPNPRARIEAIAELTRAGIRTGVLVAPLMPGINDAPEQVEEVVRLVAEAGASYIIGIPLHLRRGVREVFMAWLAARRPELVEAYELLYEKRAYLPPAERQRIGRLVDAAQVSGTPPRWRRDGEPRIREEEAPRLF